MDIQVKTKVIKRNGEEVNFDLTKIENAINKANAEVDNIYKMNESIRFVPLQTILHSRLVRCVTQYMWRISRIWWRPALWGMRGYEVAQKYVRYRYKRELARKSNTTDNGILALIEHVNEEVNQENSNKTR